MDSRTLILNERTKLIASALINLGSALLIASVARIYEAESFDIISGVWMLVAGGLVFGGWQVLSLMEKDV